MKKLIVLGFILVSLCGCDYNPQREKDLAGTIVTSYSGQKYLVEHHIGDNYTFTPIKEKNN